MNVRLFPDGKVHSAYLDLVNNPPDGVEYVGKFEFSPGTSLEMANKNFARIAADFMEMPYLFRIESDNLIHSCQKLLWTKSDFVIDIEHGNPFMGAYNIHKYKWLQFRGVVSNLMLHDNCKTIIPWSVSAMNAFMCNFQFLGKRFMRDRLKVVYPATEYVGKCRKFDKFTFIFVAGEAFYAKGGLQTLLAFEFLKRNFDYDFDLIMVGQIPKEILDRYDEPKRIKIGLHVYPSMQREYLLEMLSRCHCLVLPSHSDTFGMIVLEAKARGIPAIIADNFAAREIVWHRETGIVVDVDKTIDLRFDEIGRKRIGNGIFHRQFKNYVPDFMHVLEIANAMTDIMERGVAAKMGRRCLEETKDGKFSIKRRNCLLKEIYEDACG